MTTSNVSSEDVIGQSLIVGRKRFRLVILLSAILFLLGTITLSASALWENTTSYAATKGIENRRTVKQPQIRRPKPTSSPTIRSKHASTLGYPLVHGNTRLPEVALTFDDGPNPYYTPQVLSILQQNGINATFFDVGYLVTDYPNIVRQEYKEGNIVANHSWSHPQMTLLSSQAIMSQLTSTSKAIKDAIGVGPTFFRPPYGSMNSVVLTKARDLGFTTVLWDGSAEDWELPGVRNIVTKILYYTRNGAILLLHDGGGNRAQTVAALPPIIRILKRRGFKFVTIQQLVDDLVMPGAQNALRNTQQASTNVITPNAVFIVWRRSRSIMIY
jgi:peptidoglycan-N-acetylglucosamine deacetylase